MNSEAIKIRASIRQQITQWRKAHRILRNPRQQAWHDLARAVVKCIDEDWLAGKPFFWPSTEAGAGDGSLLAEGWQEEGLLKEFGYEVGLASELSQWERETVLAGVFECVVPPMFPPSYVAEWGPPGSAERLCKMAHTLASLVRNAKRKRGADMRSAIRDWEQDLVFLYRTYYIHRFGFAWPETEAT
jgi:hypothetical protein